MASLVAHGALWVVAPSRAILLSRALLFLAEHLVVLRVDTISLALIDNATLIKQIVAILECNHVLLLELPLPGCVLIPAVRRGRHIILRVGDSLVLPAVLLIVIETVIRVTCRIILIVVILRRGGVHLELHLLAEGLKATRLGR